MLIGFALLSSTVWADSVIEARRTAPFARIGTTLMELEGGWQAPVISPDGKRVVFSGPGLAGLWLSELNGDGTSRITDKRKAGYRPIWGADSAAIALRLADRPHAGEAMELHDLAGRFLGPTPQMTSTRVFQAQDRISLIHQGQTLRIEPDQDRFYAPILSPDSRHLVFNGLRTGLWIYRLADGRFISLGAGEHASFSADGRWLVFDRSEDDGQHITASELYLTDLSAADCPTAALTHTPQRIEQQPSLSANADRICFASQTGITCATLRFE